MTFESLCKIIDGRCLNTPAVNAYEKIETKPHLIKRGDLFVASREEEIEQAIENGANAILSDFEPVMIDSEIAWIKVDSIEKSFIKLLRFSLLKSKHTFTLLSPIQYELLKKLAPLQLLYLNGSAADNYKKLIASEEGSHCVYHDSALLKEIYPEFSTYKTEGENSLKLTHKTLFLSSFIYQGQHFQDIKIPSLFLKDLFLVLSFLEYYKFSYSIEKLDFIKQFQPLFFSNRFTMTQFGHSEHAFILIDDVNQITHTLDYIKALSSWSKILLCLSDETIIIKKQESFYFSKLEEVKSIEVDKFNFILILANYNELSNILQRDIGFTCPSLFQE